MIRTKTYEIGDRSFTKTYSDAGRYVVRDGVTYEYAVDPTELGRTYTEGDSMESPTPEEALSILLGGVEV